MTYVSKIAFAHIISESFPHRTVEGHEYNRTIPSMIYFSQILNKGCEINSEKKHDFFVDLYMVSFKRDLKTKYNQYIAELKQADPIVQKIIFEFLFFYQNLLN